MRDMVKNMISLGISRDRGRKLRSAGDEAMRLRDWPRAIESYRAYLIYRMDDAPILVQLGHALKELNQLDEAKAAYAKATVADPGDDDARVHLTAVLHAIEQKAGTLGSGQIIGSVEETDVPLPANMEQELLPSVDKSELSLGDGERDRSNWRSAARHYSAHLSDNLHDAGIWVQLGHMLKEASFHDEAIYAYRVAKRMEKKPSDVAIHLAELLMRVGRATEAKPLWAEMFQQKPTFFLRGT